MELMVKNEKTGESITIDDTCIIRVEFKGSFKETQCCIGTIGFFSDVFRKGANVVMENSLTKELKEDDTNNTPFDEEGIRGPRCKNGRRWQIDIGEASTSQAKIIPESKVDVGNGGTLTNYTLK